MFYFTTLYSNDDIERCNIAKYCHLKHGLAIIKLLNIGYGSKIAKVCIIGCFLKETIKEKILKVQWIIGSHTNEY